MEGFGYRGGIALGRQLVRVPRKPTLMSADPVLPPHHVPDANFEARLLQIRREAELKGRVDAPGVRLPGAPFPEATPENGYYRVPLLKQPQWKWQIPVYFFVGG